MCQISIKWKYMERGIQQPGKDLVYLTYYFTSNKVIPNNICVESESDSDLRPDIFCCLN